MSKTINIHDVHGNEIEIRKGDMIKFALASLEKGKHVADIIVKATVVKIDCRNRELYVVGKDFGWWIDPCSPEYPRGRVIEVYRDTESDYPLNSVVMRYGAKVGVRKIPLLRQGHFLTKWCPSIEVNGKMYCMSDVDSISGMVEADTRRAAFELGKKMLQTLPFWDAVRRVSRDLDQGIEVDDAA